MKIAIHSLHCRRDASELLRGIDLTIEPGSFTVLVGPNGAGKSTLLRLLSGEMTGYSGRIQWGEWVLEAWPVRDLARRRAVLPQESTLQFPFTVREVVLLGRAPHLNGRESAYDDEIARRALVAADLDGFAERIYTTLSGGEKQRAQFARVLAQALTPPKEESSWLLLDEPVSNLDPAHAFGLLEAVRGEVERGAGVIAVLHDLNLAARYADRIIFLKEGRVWCDGLPDEVLSPEIIRDVFSVAAEVVRTPEGAIAVHLAPLKM